MSPIDPDAIDKAHGARAVAREARRRRNGYRRHATFAPRTEAERAADALRPLNKYARCIVPGCKSAAASDSLCTGHRARRKARERRGPVEARPGLCGQRTKRGEPCQSVAGKCCVHDGYRAGTTEFAW